MCGERLFHFHCFENEDEVAFGDGVSVGDYDFDDGALHGGGEGVAGGVGGVVAVVGAAVGCFLFWRVGGVGGGEVVGEGYFDAFSFDFDDDAVTFWWWGVSWGGGSGVRGDGVVEFGFDPAGVDGERLVGVFGGVGGVVDDGAVEGECGGHSVDGEFGQGAL